MLALNVLGLSSKESHGDGTLDIYVAVDGRRNTLDNLHCNKGKKIFFVRRHGSVKFPYPLANVVILGQLAYLALVIFGQPEGSKEILLLGNKVGLDHRLEDRETVLVVGGHVKCVAVDTGDLLFLFLFLRKDQNNNKAKEKCVVQSLHQDGRRQSNPKEGSHPFDEADDRR